jgi:YD repeat-containing protein
VKRLATLALLFVLPTPAAGQALQNLANGFAVDKSYQVNDLDQISTFNGNLSINIPLGQRYPVSSALSYQFILNYGGNTWSFDWELDYWTGVLESDPEYSYATREIVVNNAEPGPPSLSGGGQPGNAGHGWYLSLGRLEPKDHMEAQGNSVYVSPDGARHEFYHFLHSPNLEPDMGVQYTRDGSYLRRQVVDGLIEIQFPDGARHRFESTGKFRIVSMLDAFGNEVTISYGHAANCVPKECVDDWTIHDRSRTHTVDMMLLGGSIGGEAVTAEVVQKLVLSTAAGPATYSFDYEGEDALVGISRRVAPDQDCRFGPVVLVPILETVTLPDGSQYKVTTDHGDATFNQTNGWTGTFASPDGEGGGHQRQPCGAATVVVNPVPSFSGTVRSLERPTGARTSWGMQLYEFPPLALPINGPCPPDTHCQQVYLTQRDAVGVSERVDRTREGTLLSRRTYVHEYASATQTAKTTINTFNDDTDNEVSASENYYRVPYTTGSLKAEYGLPFTRATSDTGNRFLSTRLKDADGNVLHETYVLYDADEASVPQTDPSSTNRRVREERNVRYGAAGAVTNDLTTTSTDFDGFGHYRIVTTTSSPYGALPLLSRTVTTRYHQRDDQTDPDAEYKGTRDGTFQQFWTDRPWVLNTYSSQTVSSSGASAKALFDFDPITGFLNRKRTLANISTTGAPVLSTNDLLAVFSRDASGNVTSEQYYGGDDEDGADDGNDQRLSTTAPLVSMPLPATAVTSLTHSYEHGALETSRYSSAAFDSVDRTIDPATGLTETSTDPAGVTTGFEYDWAGRLLWSIPTGGAATGYGFTPAGVTGGVFVPASVSIEQRNGGKTGSVLIAASVTYDQLGRVATETRTMPDGTASSRSTTCDVRGLVQSVSEWGNANRKTSYTYDALGRLLTTTAPDGSVVSFTYDGGRTTQRETKVATCTDFSPANCNTATATWSQGKAVMTTETVDDFGRLVQIVEPGGTTTTYGYDLGDRLVSVDMGGQGRSFAYDGRGFLAEETHPESGTTTYAYDARGHVTRRTAAAGTSSETTVGFTYDAAERITSVFDETDDLKVFTYDRSATDRSMGKLASATRYNRGLPDGTVQVTETYHYDGATNTAGRLSKKVTTVSSDAGTQTFTDGYVYDRLGAVTSLTYPACAGCGTLQAPVRTVGSSYKAGFLTGVAGYTNTLNGLTYWPNGMLKAVTHTNVDGTNGPVDTYALDSSTGMARPLSITFSGFCNDFSVQELASKSVVTGSAADLTAAAPGATTFQWYEVAADGSEAKLTGQTTSTLTVNVSTTRRFRVRAGNGNCTIDSNVATVTADACTAPNVSVTMAGTLARNQPAQASVPDTPGGTYSWTVTGGTITSGQAARTVNFTVDCTANAVTVAVAVKPACSSTPTNGAKAANTTAAVSVALSSARSSIPQGSSEAITVKLTGTAPWTVSWSDGASWTGSTSQFNRTVTPAATTTYTATVTDANGCQDSDSLPITVVPPAPSNLAATVISGTQVQLSWRFSGSADSFEVERRAAGGGFVWETTTNATSITRAATADRAYLYRVRAVKGGTSSAWSGVDLATTVAFGGDVIAGTTTISASHILQLRTAANAVRALWSSGLAPVAFTDPVLQGVAAKALHIVEIRNALNAARTGLGLPAWTYTTPAPVAGQPFAAAHGTTCGAVSDEQAPACGGDAGPLVLDGSCIGRGEPRPHRISREDRAVSRR